ncbi:MAG TPA: hypothetical protein PLE24_11715 [Chitinispirillaceae bacterium]|jgi:hypothetical protein|nr:hypothetical protein [Chitinispirillaceae bacterium]
MKTGSFLLLISASLGLFWPEDIPGQCQSSSVCFEKGIRNIERGKPDSALFYLQKSFSAGLGDDSLYYLWSEIYLRRGVLDTALGLSYASNPERDKLLYRKVLLQRYLIYSALGWQKEAGQVADSLEKLTYNRLMRFVPDVAVSLGSGFISERETAKEAPFEASIDPQKSKNALASLSTDLRWKLPLTASQGFRAETRLGISGSNFALPVTRQNLNDSLETFLSAGLRYYLFSEQISLGYTWSRKLDLYDFVYHFNKLDARFFLINNQWSALLECGYDIKTNENPRRFYSLLFLDRLFPGGKGISFTLDFSGYRMQDIIVPDTVQYYVKYVDDFTFYTDSTFTDTFSTPLSRYDLMRGSNLTRSYTELPRSFISLNPSFSFRFGPWKDISFGMGAGYNLIKYIGEYVWLDLVYSKDQIQNEFVLQNPYVIIAMNKLDRRYYLIREIDYPGREMTLDSIPVNIRREKRVDNTFNINLFLNKSIGKLGDVNLRGDLSRNYSNLQHDAPEVIPEFSFRIFLSMRFLFNPPGFHR